MIRNYFIIAWRSLIKNRFFTLLNISGLAVSLVVAIFLLSYAQQELSFNSMFSQKENIYRVNMEMEEKYNFEKWTVTPNFLGPTMLEELPEVETMARLVRYNFGGTSSLSRKKDNFLIENFYVTDATFFDLFDFDFIEGSKDKVFKNPNSIVISETESKKIFGEKSALDEQVEINQEKYTVTGVFKDLPYNTTFDGSIYTNILDSWMGKRLTWDNSSFETYILLHSDAKPAQVAQNATNLIEKYINEENRYYTKFLFQSLNDIYLYSADLDEPYSSKSGNINQVKLFFTLAILIIGIATINYVNLSTAKTQTNAKEVGVNKVLGANATQIRLRFYIETSVLVLIAMCIALVLIFALMPWFNNLTGNEFSITKLFSFNHLMTFIGLWVLISFLGGFYPAFVMTKLPSLGLMKHWTERNLLSEFVRSGLVAFQFVCSMVLIVGVLIMNKQISYINNKDLGYTPDQILSIPLAGFSKWQQLSTALTQINEVPGTTSASLLQSYPGYLESGKNVHKIGRESEASLPVLTNNSYASVVNTLGLNLIAGSDLPKTITATDSTTYLLINEVVAAYLGYESPDDAVGQTIGIWSEEGVINGVVRNFNSASLKEKVGAYVFYKTNAGSEGYNYLLLNFNNQNVGNYLAQVQEIIEAVVPESAFEYKFLGDHIKNQYRAENRSEAILTVFSVLAIFIACLGLFGLAAFAAEQRKKEIGVRKVLGASVAQITKLLSTQFSKLILLALLISIPLGWWIFSEWLNSFAYRISMDWKVFVFAAFLVLLIAAVPIGFQSIKAARSNPVESLRDE